MAIYISIQGQRQVLSQAQIIYSSPPPPMATCFGLNPSFMWPLVRQNSLYIAFVCQTYFIQFSFLWDPTLHIHISLQCFSKKQIKSNSERPGVPNELYRA